MIARRLIRQCNKTISWADQQVARITLKAGHEAAETAPLFILGAPRSGTTITYQLMLLWLNGIYFPRILDFGYGLIFTSMFMLRRALRPEKYLSRSSKGRIPGAMAPSEAFGFWSMWLSSCGPNGHYLTEAEATDRDFSGMADIIAALESNLSRRLVVKCLYLSFHVRILARVFPRARFVLVKRDPFYVCQSLLEARKRFPDRWWSIAPPGYRQWSRLPLVDQVCRQVAFTTALTELLLNRYAQERYATLQYEELCRDPAGVLAGLSPLLGLVPSAGSHHALPATLEISQKVQVSKREHRQIVTSLSDCRREERHWIQSLPR